MVAYLFIVTLLFALCYNSKIAGMSQCHRHSCCSVFNEQAGTVFFYCHKYREAVYTAAVPPLFPGVYFINISCMLTEAFANISGGCDRRCYTV